MATSTPINAAAGNQTQPMTEASQIFTLLGSKSYTAIAAAPRDILAQAAVQRDESGATPLEYLLAKKLDTMQSFFAAFTGDDAQEKKLSFLAPAESSGRGSGTIFHTLAKKNLSNGPAKFNALLTAYGNQAVEILNHKDRFGYNALETALAFSKPILVVEAFKGLEADDAVKLLQRNAGTGLLVSVIKNADIFEAVIAKLDIDQLGVVLGLEDESGNPVSELLLDSDAATSLSKHTAKLDQLITAYDPTKYSLVEEAKTADTNIKALCKAIPAAPSDAADPDPYAAVRTTCSQKEPAVASKLSQLESAASAARASFAVLPYFGKALFELTKNVKLWSKANDFCKTAASTPFNSVALTSSKADFSHIQRTKSGMVATGEKECGVDNRGTDFDGYFTTTECADPDGTNPISGLSDLRTQSRIQKWCSAGLKCDKAPDGVVTCNKVTDGSTLDRSSYFKPVMQFEQWQLTEILANVTQVDATKTLQGLHSGFCAHEGPKHSEAPAVLELCICSPADGSGVTTCAIKPGVDAAKLAGWVAPDLFSAEVDLSGVVHAGTAPTNGGL